MSTFPERLSAAIAEKQAAGISQNSIEAKAGLKTGYLSPLRKGERAPSFDKAVSLADALGVRLEWLVAGRGPMYEPPKEPTTPVGLARAAAVVLGFPGQAIDAGVSASAASNDVEDAWEVLTRIHSAARKATAAPSRLPATMATRGEGAANATEPPPEAKKKTMARRRKASGSDADDGASVLGDVPAANANPTPAR